MQNLVTQIQPLVKVRRNRSLPVSGTVLVHVGQKVTAGEIIAEGSVPTRHILIDVIQSLGLKKLEEAERLITRKVGEQVDKHDILVESGGLFSRVIRAPIPGKIVSIKNGQILLEVETRKVTVQSGLNGRVIELIKDHGAVIESNCALIQGVWGNGKIGFGPYLPDTCDIDDELTPSCLSITARGTIVVAAHCENEESLLAAAGLPIGGLILGSMSPKLITCAQNQDYPIVLLEGFGKTSINAVAKDVIVANLQREMCINATKWDRFNGLRPEISISSMNEGDLEIESAELAQGQTVRIHSSSHAGQVGVINDIHQTKTSLPNGLRALTASITMPNNDTLVIPCTNFDMINVETRTLG